LFRIAFSPAAREEIRELRESIARKRSRRVASKYIRRLKAFCQELSISPHRGESRPGVKANQRTIGFEARISIIFYVSDEDQLVTIVGVRYGGRELNSNHE